MVVILALAACGGGQVPGDVDEGNENDSRAMGVIKEILDNEDQTLHMSFATEFGNDLMEVELFIKGKNIRMDSSDPEQGKFSIITNESGSFYVIPEYKAYYKLVEPAEDMAFMLTEEEVADYVVTTGEEEINGVLYDFERLTGTDEEVTFYFVPGTDQWAALKTAETMMYIHEISKEVEDSVFVIPVDFQEVTL